MTNDVSLTAAGAVSRDNYMLAVCVTGVLHTLSRTDDVFHAAYDHLG